MMKFDNAVNIKIDEKMARYLGKIITSIDCTQSEFIRTCIHLAGPQIERHPYLIQLLPHSQDSLIQQS
jgi:hypothetical protein